MTLKEKLSDINTKRQSLLAVNFYNAETLLAIVRAASLTSGSLILQLSPGTIRYLGLKLAVRMARSVLDQNRVEGWLHLDHAGSPGLIRECLDEGFDSVMIDASEKPMEENITISRRIVDLASSYDAPVEAELGYVPKPGQEITGYGFTEPQEAKYFMEETGIDMLAVSIGTVHGFYKGTPNIDLQRLISIKKLTSAPLVLHGSSGIPDKMLQEAVKAGICKINLATEVKNAFIKTLRQDLQTGDEIDPRKVFPPAMEKVTKLVQKKLTVINHRRRP